MTDEPKFQVGDVVEWAGCRGVVVLIEPLSRCNNTVSVRFENGRAAWFTCTGHYCEWHTEPSLKLIERPKKEEPEPKMVEREVWRVVWSEAGGSLVEGARMFKTKEQALEDFGTGKRYSYKAKISVPEGFEW